MSQQVYAAIAIGIFVVLLLMIGVGSLKKSKDMNSFLLGGGKVGPWMSAFAYGTTYFSAVIFVGYAGRIGWTVGIGGILIGVGNAIVGSWLAWTILAKRSHDLSRALGTCTMPSLFGKRFQSKKLKIAAAVLIFIFLLPYAASVYMGLAYLVYAIFPGIDYVWCMFFIAALTGVYLVMGGYNATKVADFVMAIVMIIGVLVMVLFSTYNPVVGGLASGLKKLAAIDPELISITGGSHWMSIFGAAGLTSIGCWAMPQMVHKYYAIDDDAAIKKGTIISTLFAAIIGCGAYLVGSYGRLYLNNQVPAEGFDKVVPDMLLKVFAGDIGGLFLALILLCVLSASMSTLASVILTSSSAISVDLLEEVRPDISKKKQMAIMRICCAVFIILSFLIASRKIAFILAMTGFSWGVLAGAFMGPYLWGVCSKKTTRAGAWAGVISGLLTMACLVSCATLFTAGGFETAKTYAAVFGIIAMVVSFIAVPIGSMLTKEDCTIKLNL